MTREDIEKILGSEIDKEVITELLNRFHAELTKEKEKAQVSLDKAKDLSDQLDTANQTIKSLEKNAQDSEEVKKEIESYKSQIEELEERNRADKIDFAIDAALKEAKAIDPQYARVGLNMDTIRLEKDGTVSGIKDQIKTLKKDKAFLFEQEDKPPKTNYEPRAGKSRISSSPNTGEKWAKFFSNQNKQGFSIKGEKNQ